MINNKDSMSKKMKNRNHMKNVLVAVLIAAFAAALVSIFFPFPWLLYTLSFLILLSLVLVLLFMKSGSKGFIPGKEEESEITTVQLSMREENGSEAAAAELKKREIQITALKEELGPVKKSVHEFISAVPMEERLARVIVDMTEASTLELTEHVYSLAEKSRLLSDKIRDHLESLTSGESSLAVEISTLRQEVKETNHVIRQFHEVREQQFADMKTVTDAVQSVGEYIATISELAEQTGILAINASIEAARAGNVGKGFAVIAGEVHKLADASRDVAVSIGSTLESARVNIHDSFKQQNGRIEDAVGRLEKGQADQLRRADILFPHVEKIGEGIESTRAISDMVQNELDNISASLQSQDSVRQIIEHMILFLQDLRKRASSAGFREDPEIIDELEKLLVRHFTTRAEWQAFGRTLDEALQTNEKSMEKDNITLF